jgi:hypothetical protein
VEDGKFVGTPDEGITRLGAMTVDPRPALDNLLHAVDWLDLRYRTARGRLPELSPHLLLHELVGGMADEDGLCGRHVSETGGQVNGVPHGRIEPLSVVWQVSHHHRSGLHADGHGKALGVLLPPELLPQVKGRQHRPPCVVFIGHRGAEQGHEPVHPILDDAAPVLLYCGLNTRQEGLHALIHRLRI